MIIGDLIKKKSASPTNIYLSTLSSGEECVFKMFLLPDPDFIREFNKVFADANSNEEATKYVNNTNGLVYEAKVYSEFSYNINKSNVSPNFLKPLEDGNEVVAGYYDSGQTFFNFLRKRKEISVSNPIMIKSLEDLYISALRLYNHAAEFKKFEEDISATTDPFLINKIKADMYKYKNTNNIGVNTYKELKEMYTKDAKSIMYARRLLIGLKFPNTVHLYSVDAKTRNRDEINIFSQVDLHKYIFTFVDRCKVVGIVTEKINNSTPLYKVIKALKDKEDIMVKELYNIFFQIVAGLHVMDKYHLQHNDLHDGNVMVKVHSSPIFLEYNIKDTNYDKKFRLETMFELKFYDWDSAFYEKIGPNTKIETNFWKRYGILNKFIPFFDTYTISCMSNKNYRDPSYTINQTNVRDIFYLKPDSDYIKSGFIYDELISIKKRPPLVDFNITPLTNTKISTSIINSKRTILESKRSLPTIGVSKIPQLYEKSFLNDGFECRANSNIDKLQTIFRPFVEKIVNGIKISGMIDEVAKMPANSGLPELEVQSFITNDIFTC